MTEEHLPVKKEKRQTIFRTVHNREKPFVQLEKKSLWDDRLSLKAVGLWARCMSKPNDWKFSIAQIATMCKEGRGAIDAAMKELIAAGYVYRMEYRERLNGKYFDAGVEYVFFEYPATEEEKLEQLEIFKKSFQDCGFQNSGFQNSGNRTLLIKSYTEKDSTKKETTPPIPPHSEPSATAESATAESAIADDVGVVDSLPVKKKKAASEFSLAVKQTGETMINIAMRCNPVYRPPDDLRKFLENVELMLEKDKQNKDLLLQTFEWACQDTEERDKFKGWQSVICSNKRKGKVSNPAEIFRGHFSSIYAQMSSRPKRKFAPCSDSARGMESLARMKETAL